MSKITAFHRAKKLAIQRASEGAFSKVLIVVLANGKVAVEINSTSVDALHFVTQEELKGVVTVSISYFLFVYASRQTRKA